MPEKRTYAVIPTLREAMAKRGVKLTDLSKLTGIPYRSLQNYFSEKTEMTVSVFLRLCEQLGMDPMYVSNQSFKLEETALRQALVATIGHGLPTHQFNDDGSMGLVAYAGPPRSEHDLWRDAATAAVFVGAAYDRHLEHDMFEPLLDENEGAPNGSPKSANARRGSPKSEIEPTP